VLGKPLQVLSNDPSVIAAAECVLGHWRHLEPALVEQVDPMIVRVVVHGENGSGAARARPVYRLHADTFMAALGDDLLTAQLDRGTALAFVSPATAADAPYLRYHVLQLLALVLTSWRHQDRIAIHAGGLVGRRRAVVLAGRSGAGKSTLCYACWRAGMRLLAEDALYISRRQGLRIWGNPGSISLLADAPGLFPELAGLPLSPQSNGEMKLTVDAHAAGPDRVALHAEAAAICLLEQHDGERAELLPVGPDVIAERMYDHVAAGAGLYAEYLPEVVGLLAQGGAYVLRTGRDLEAAVEAVRSLGDQ
jgi:hypothetical protein